MGLGKIEGREGIGVGLSSFVWCGVDSVTSNKNQRRIWRVLLSLFSEIK